MAIQTPRQRLANEKFAKKNERQMGKPKPKKQVESKTNIPRWVIALLCFLLIGGGLLEVASMFM